MTSLSMSSVQHGGKLSISQAILWGGVVVGVLDATDGVIAYWLHAHLNPIQVLQYIASGTIGQSSFQGGLATAGLGVVLHFFISFVVVAIYVLASRRMPILNRNAIVFGLLYGALVYLIMTYGVLPLSAVAPSPFSFAMFLNGVVGHALFVGLPSSLFSRASS